MTKKNASKTFGHVLREKRVAPGFSLRKFVSEVGVRPTYLSQVEQDNVDPPTAVRVKRMADLLNENVAEWTALAGRLTEDLPEIIRGAPQAVPDLLLAVRGLTGEQLRQLQHQAKRFRSEASEKE